MEIADAHFHLYRYAKRIIQLILNKYIYINALI